MRLDKVKNGGTPKKRSGKKFFKGLTPVSKKLKRKYKFFAFDIETTGHKNDFYMGSIYGVFDKRKGVEAKVFYDKKEMASYIYNTRLFYRDCYLVAHNLQFDFFGIFEDTDVFNDTDLLFVHSSLISATIKNESKIYKSTTKEGRVKTEKAKSKIRFIDLANFFGMQKLESLAKIIGNEKFGKPKCLGKFPKNDEEKNELEGYNIQDSRVTYNLMEFFQDETQKLGGDIKITIASTTMQLFRKQFLEKKFKQPKKDILKRQYDSYYGGRTEVFKRGVIEKDIYYYDVNSLYPSVMREAVPDPNTIEEIKDFNNKYIWFYEGLSEVNITTPPNLKFPLLPVRTDKLIFPTGTFRGTFTHVELRKAMELGYKINNIYYQQIFRKNVDVFSNYVDTMYSLRNKFKAENNPAEKVVKIFMNSLYGKFAQKIDGQQKTINLNNEDHIKYYETALKDTERFNISFMNDYLLTITDTDAKKFSGFITPIWASYITARARLLLYSYFEQIQEKGGEIYYCDTDSVFTSIKLDESDELGEMKNEVPEGITKAIFIKPKMYGYETVDKKFKKRIKGVRLDSILEIINNKEERFNDIVVDGVKKRIQLKSIEDFKVIVQSRIKNIRFTKFKTATRSKESGKHGKLKTNQILEIEKNLTLDDEKRVWKDKFDFSEQDSEPINI